MRPGRFDRHITIDLPTMKERVELFELYLRKLKLSLPVSSLAPRLAQLTPRMSGNHGNDFDSPLETFELCSGNTWFNSCAFSFVPG